MPPCIIKTCPNWQKFSRDYNTKYFKFPEKNPILLEKWKRACNLTDKISLKRARICSLHFTPDSFEKKSTYAGETLDELKSTAVPIPNLARKPEPSPVKRKVLIKSVSSNETPAKKTRDNINTPEHHYNGIHANYLSPVNDSETSHDEDINNLQSENKILKQRISEMNEKLMTPKVFIGSKIRRKVFEVLGPVLQIGEINKFLHPENQSLWTREDLETAIALRCLIKSNKKIPYLKNSDLSSYKKQLVDFTLKPGIIRDFIPFICEKHKNYALHEKLSFLHLQDLNFSTDFLSNDRVLYGMLHGLCRKWKNLIYFNYDQPYSAEIFSEIVETAQIMNHTVVAIVTDLQSTHVWNALQIGISNDKYRYFTNPSYDNLKVFAFVDPIELIRVLRNYFLDFGFQYKDQLLDKQCLEELLTLDDQEIMVPNKLQKKHLDVTGFDRYGMSLATEVFSNTTAQCIKWCGNSGLLASEYWSECADFIKTINDWFDIINIKNPNDPIFGVYGTDVKKQNEILDKMTSYMEDIRVHNHSNLLPFQKGIILNNLSLKELLPYLQNQYDSPQYLINQISFCFH